VPSAQELPDINHLVRVSLGVLDDLDSNGFPTDVPSRIQDLDRDPKTKRITGYVIAAPVFAGDIEGPVPGAECRLQWVSVRGIYTLPTTFLKRETIDNGLRVWRLRVTGAPIRDQRRRYFRVQSAIRTELEIRRDLENLDQARLDQLERAGIREALADLPPSLEAVALNISEGGLRCLTPAEPVLPADLPLIARFTLGSANFEIPAYVVWSAVRDYNGKAAVESALAFDDPGKKGDTLRPLLFEVQLKARRAGLE